MKLLGSGLAIGLLAGLTGCANLNRGMAFRPATERSNPPAAAAAASAELEAPKEADGDLVDPFKPQAEAPTARLSRYFPGFSRTNRSQPPATDSLRRPGPANTKRDRNLEAVPRPSSADDSDTIVVQKPRAQRPAPVAALDPASTQAVVDPASPLLEGAVVAEADPDEKPEPVRVATPAERIRRAGRTMVASTAIPTPSPSYDAAFEAPTTRKVTREELLAARDLDRDARRAAVETVRPAPAPARDEEPTPRPEPVAEVEKKREAVDAAPNRTTEPEPVAVASVPQTEPPVSRNLDPPRDEVAEAETKAETKPAPAEAKTPVAEKPPVHRAPEPVAIAEVPNTPPQSDVEMPKVVSPRNAPATPETPVVASERPRASASTPSTERPRASAPPVASAPAKPTRLEIQRSTLPPDLPPALFPPTYYQSQQTTRPRGIAALKPKRDDEATPARWTWTPRLFRRLRGESAPAAPEKGVSEPLIIR